MWDTSVKSFEVICTYGFNIVGLVAGVDMINNWITVINDKAFVNICFLSMEFSIATNDFEDCFEAVPNLNRKWLCRTSSSRSDKTVGIWILVEFGSPV